MLIRQVALYSKTKKVTLHELTRVSAALQRQATRDLSPIWNVSATVDAFGAEPDIPPGYWKIAVMDQIPGKGTSGFHVDKHGQPYADVQWSPTWSLAASHECLEMLVDPFGRQTVSGPSPKKGQDRVNFLLEVCDPCESPAFAYMINTETSNEVVVSDFYTPEYFAPLQSAGVRYSFRGSISTPRQVLTGGYLSWFNPSNGHIWQLFGPAALDHFIDQGVGTLDRETTDGHSRTARHKHAAKKQKPVRRSRLMAAAGGQCNLTPDAVGGVVDGTAGNQTTVQIKDSTGKAVFHSISYNKTQIGSDTASVDFTIVAGDKDLTFVYGAPIAGDQINIVDPCGTVLDSFPNNPGSSRVSITVSA
jgi:hypothetical protein